MDGRGFGMAVALERRQRAGASADSVMVCLSRAGGAGRLGSGGSREFIHKLLPSRKRRRMRRLAPSPHGIVALSEMVERRRPRQRQTVAGDAAIDGIDVNPVMCRRTWSISA